jgi:signal transduction histidine kinase
MTTCSSPDGYDLRVTSGFEINQKVAEYRSLRAGVMRQWSRRISDETPCREELVRFHAALDQAIVESVSLYFSKAEASHDLLLGMLGHDMRSPLNTVLMIASYLAALNAGKEVSEAATLLSRSGAALKELVDDLADFNRTKLGLGINVRVAEMNLADVVRDELEQLRTAHVDRRIELDIAGDTKERWDGHRLQQVVRNLVDNAIKYGSAATPVRVALRGEDRIVRLEVANEGQPMNPTTFQKLVEPLKRGAGQREGGLGLGLFIVREITRAHGGDFDVRCEERETIFSVTLPRRRNAAPHRALLRFDLATQTP